MKSRRRALVPALALAAALIGPAATSAPVGPPPGGEPPSSGKVRVEVPPTTAAPGRYVDVPAAQPTAPQRRSAQAAPTVTALAETGPSDSRVDVVIMGDGYTADEQDEFEADARRQWQAITEVEPYRSYRGLMNVWLVGAVSRDSGVSRDMDTNPGAVQDKDTALGGYFWCGGTERLMCVDTDRTKDYAQLAPDVDLAVVVGNSTRYGGAGYFRGDVGFLPEDFPFSGIATLSSDHAQSSLIGSHEIGHSLGELGDEYHYCGTPGYEVYCEYHPGWGELEEPNLTIHGPGEGFLRDNEYKWWRWLGEADPSGGTTGVYEGGGYFGHGIYRPSASSIMQTLASTEFNHPGREAMIDGFYRYGEAMHGDVPSGSTIRRSDTVTVHLADVTGLADVGQVRWYVDGREARQARGLTTVVPQRLGVPASGATTLTATVVDETASVRDPQVREAATTTLSWTVSR